jgi:hypothetical protein
MPRHNDKRLRLVRIEHGPRWQGSDASGNPVRIAGPFANECNCGLPWCSWSPQKRARAERGYQARTGAWQTADGRFRLEWHGQHSNPSRSHPDGWLYVSDTLRRVSRYVVTMRDAREWIAAQYDRSGVVAPPRKEKR